MTTEPSAENPRRTGAVVVLESIAARARRTLADPSKARWHRQETELLERVERELERLRAAELPH
jgi:hypothetical protein